MHLDLDWDNLDEFMKCDDSGKCEIDAEEDDIGDYNIKLTLADDFYNEVSYDVVFKVQDVSGST